MNEGLDIIFSVWGNRKGYIFTPAKNPKTNEWNEQSFVWPKERKKVTKWIIESESQGKNIYWCPTLFSQPIRKKEYINKVQCLWADLDEVNPKKIESKLRPHLAYETSPKRFQCLWYLEEDYTPEDAESINRNITYHIGADKGGWDLTQVLRIPGLKNFKYKNGPQGNILWNKEDNKRSLDYFSFVPENDEADDIDDEEVEWDEDTNLGTLVSKHKKLIKGKLFDLVFSTEDEVASQDRSERLWELECRLLEAGIPVGDVINIVRLSNWNKYAGRNDERKRILTEVRKAQAEVKANGGKGEYDLDDSKFRDRFGKTWTTYSDLLGMQMNEPGWLIEGWWQKDSHGMVAGEPKTYKSSLVADVAVSVASGQPLFGKFAVHNPGPVIMIQEENSPFLMQDRFRKVSNSKGLIKGKVNIRSKQTVDVTFPVDLPIDFLNNKGFDFSEEESRDILEKRIKKLRPVLVIFDPLYLMLGGKDENSSKDLRPLLNWLIHLRYTYKTAIMVVHHWNKSGTSSRGGQRMLGSVTLHGWVESAIYSLIKNEEEHEVTIDREFRSFPKPKTIGIKYTMGNPGDDMYEPEIDDSAGNSDDDLLLLIRSTNGMTEKDLLSATGIGRTSMKSRLSTLERKGIIYCDKAKRPALWFATTEPEVNE